MVSSKSIVWLIKMESTSPNLVSPTWPSTSSSSLLRLWATLASSKRRSCRKGVRNCFKNHLQHMQFTSSQDIFVDFRFYYRILKGCVECSGRSRKLYGKRTLLQRLPRCSEFFLAVPAFFLFSMQ